MGIKMRILSLLFLYFLGLLYSASGQNTNPSCSSYLVFHSFNESTNTGALLPLDCTDGDPPPNGTLTFSIKSGNDLGQFSIDSTTGEISLASTIDYDDVAVPHLYTLIIEVSDGGSPSLTATNDVSVMLQVTGVNDIDPEFLGTLPYTVTHPENLGFSDLIFAPSVNDSDVYDDAYTLQTFTCSIVPSSPDFAINPTTCEVRLAKNLDFETATSHTITLQIVDNPVNDAHSLSRTAQTTLTVTVTNVNEYTPSCTVSQYIIGVPENTTSGGALIKVDCTDNDSGVSGTVSYSIESGNGDGYFSINGNGDITLANTFDCDDFGLFTRSYQLKVRATDGGSPPLFTDTDLTFNFEGINDIDPVFQGMPYSTTLPENLALNGFVYEAFFLDMDILDSAFNLQTVKCSMAGGDTAMFNCKTESFSCKCTLAKSFDFETATSHTLTLQIDDEGFTPARTAQETLTITISDVNENTPTFSDTALVATVFENATVGGAAILTLTCTDSDPGAAGTVSYSIISGNDDGYFGITTTGSNGEINLANTFDYEDFGLLVKSFKLTVQASDGGVPSLSSTVIVDFSLQGINDNTPVFQSTPYTTTLPENLNVGGFVYETFWLDLDNMDEMFNFQTVKCSMIGGDTTMFNCVTMKDNFSCKCTLAKALDFETATSHTITLQIEDVGLTPVLTAQETLTVTVTDVNDNAPICSPDQISHSMTENTVVSTALVNLTGKCSDAETTSSALSYSITSGSTAKFQMNGAVLELKDTIDIDTESSDWQLQITVTDTGTITHNAVVNIAIAVSGVDDNPPVWHTDNNGVYTSSIIENSSTGTPVVTITATDTDLIVSEDAKITYGIETATTLFGIVQSTGEIYVLSPDIDRETTSSHVLTVYAYSSTLSDFNITGTVTISVNDANDNVPKFTQDSYTVTLAEDSPVTAISFVPPIGATDTDAGVNGDIDYVLTGTAHTVPGCQMSIDTTSGVISSTNNLDYETSRRCIITIEARDRGSPGLTGTATAIITVTGVNEFNPSFTGTPYTVDVPENTAIGSALFTVVATDMDDGDDGRIQFFVTSHTSVFSVGSTTGIIRLLSNLDSETLNVYTVNVEAVDQSPTNNLTGVVTLTLNVLDVNEFTPNCTNVVYVMLTSPVTINDVINTIDCVDNDVGINGQITYTIISGNTNSDFAVQTNGDISIANLPSDRSYNLHIQAQDQAASPLSSTVYVNVVVVAEPTFHNLPDAINITEGSSISTGVFIVIGNSSTISKTFTITDGNQENKFILNVYTGTIYLLHLLDRETTPSYVLTIQISDDISSTSTNSTLSITVTDSNDNSPRFPNDFYNISIVENVTPTTEIIDIAASDSDTGLNQLISYTITDGNPGSVFSVTSAGKLILNSALDVETTPSYTLIITAEDSGLPPLTGTTTCFITISDVDEFPTEFLSTSAGGIYTKSLSEDTAIGTKVFNVSAQDLDITAQNIMYSITSGNDGSFLMVEYTGEIFLSKLLDRETTASYSLTVQADNGLGDTPTATLNIVITDVNDNQPQFTPFVGTYNVDENEALGAMITTIVCSDADDGLNGNLTYAITGGNTGTTFRLDRTVVELNIALNYETTSQYILVIEATDQGTPARTASVSLIIDVNPIYPLPKHISGSASISVPENRIVGTVIYDDDATILGAVEGVSGDLEYTIQSGNADGKFHIDQYTGEIKVIASLDRDTTPSYTLLIKAVNRNDPSKTDFLVLTVNLGDINDITPVFGSSLYTFVVNEDASITTVFGTVTASDNDDGVNSDITYSITSGENMNHFEISPTNGDFSVKMSLDAAQQSTYFLIVSAVDGGTPALTGRCEVIITVNDINDKTPTFDSPSYNLSLSETASVGSTISQFRGTDGDTGPNGILTYYIASGNGDLRYTLDANNGNLLIGGILDRETTDNYVLVAEVRDSGIPVNTGTTTLYITIADENDNDPIISSGGGSFTIIRNSNTGTDITTITATDADINNNGVVEYYITSGNSDSLFYIDSSTGIIQTVNNLATAADTYDLTIQAVDKGKNRNTATVTVQIIIDPPLTPTPSNYTASVMEDDVVGTPILTVNPDLTHLPGATIHFTIQDGNVDNAFTIDTLNGLITTAKLLDHHLKPEYYLTVNVEDQGDPTKNYNQAVHITVTDVNNNSPIFETHILVLNVVENSPVGLSFGSDIATDNDAGAFGTVTYQIDPTDTAATSMFSVDTSGVLRLTKSPDFEQQTFYSFYLYAMDGGAPSLTGAATINVNIIDVSDSSTATSNSPGYFSLECPTNANTNDFIVMLTPVDFGMVAIATDTVQYITMNDDGVFGFNSSGAFYVLNSQYLYEQTRYIMWAVLRIQSITGDANGTSAMVRVDSLTPNQHLVIIKHSVSADVLEIHRNALKSSLQSIFAPNRVGIWRINGISAARRRRLLAAESESIVYVCDTAADTLDGISNEKTCLSQSDIQQVLSQSDGTPATVLTTADFSLFPVTSVEPYIDSSASSSTNWAQTTVGIAVIAIISGSFLLLAVILILYFLCTRDGKYKFNEDKDESLTNYNNNPSFEYVTKPKKAAPIVMKTSTPVFSGIGQSQSILSDKSSNSSKSTETKQRKDKQILMSSLMNGHSTKNDVPPALFHEGKYMKENPNAEVAREGTITPRQILIESKRPMTEKSHSSY